MLGSFTNLNPSPTLPHTMDYTIEAIWRLIYQESAKKEYQRQSKR